MSVMLLLAAIVGGWIVQLLLTQRQSTAFARMTSGLRAKGIVSIGTGGRRYRGGIAFVALAIDERGYIAEALSLRGWTTFARPHSVPGLSGQKLSTVRGERAIVGVAKNEREAARQAAVLVRQATKAPVAG